jgi:hypothetical protein
MNRTELQMKYKAETAEKPCETSVFARIGRFGDVIVDPDLPPRVMRDIKETGFMDYPDLDYVQWLEEKLMELLTK